MTYAELLSDVKVELGISVAETEDDAVITKYLRDAVRWVNNRRRYAPVGEELCEPQFLSTVGKLAVFSYAKRGAEGQNNHAENGISRTWAGQGSYPPDLMREVPPVVKVYNANPQ